MKYIKTFESIDRMPKECSLEDAVEKTNNHKREKLSEYEIESISNTIGPSTSLSDSSISIKNSISRHTTAGSIVITKLQDNWFIIIVNFLRPSNQFYIADEFVEVQNFLLSYKNNKIAL